MSDDDFMDEILKAMRDSRRPVDTDKQGQAGNTGTGDFAGNLGGHTLRQFVSGSLGGSTEKLLSLQADGQFQYREVSQYDGGVVRGDPEFGTWSATGNFPTGHLTLDWALAGVTQHVIEFHGGDTCRFDGVPTQIL